MIQKIILTTLPLITKGVIEIKYAIFDRNLFFNSKS